MSTGLEVVVDGNWLSLEALYGDVEQSTIWPGGSDQLTWTPGTLPAHRYRGGEKVAAFYGGACVWAGSLLEPDPSQDQLAATGAFREGEGFAALNGSGDATAFLNTAVDTAIAAGLRWTRPASLVAAAATVDLTQGPLKVGDLLDQGAEENTVRWGVDPLRQVFTKADDTTPTYQTLPLDGGLGYALDNYASTLVGRYLDSGTSTYKTASATDTDAEDAHGTVQDLVDLTVRGAITTTKATSLLTSLLKLGRAVPQWTTGIELSYGELLNMAGVPVALETVKSDGRLLRVHGGFELAQRLNGQMYVDVPIGGTHLAGGLLTIIPANVVVGTLADAITAALSKKKGAA